jgi:superfamily I DNA and RNA helicase
MNLAKCPPSLRTFFAGLHQDVQQLTHDQYRVIQQLRYLRRVRISGCAGSGKTLVAAEKGSRLSAAGLRVLLMCHNPLLAEHIGRLVAGTGTEVADFVSWLSTIAGIRDDVRRSDWSHFNEPDQTALDRALESLGHADMKYDAIIVDEAQDFRDEWWVVVEAGLCTLPSPALALRGYWRGTIRALNLLPPVQSCFSRQRRPTRLKVMWGDN